MLFAPLSLLSLPSYLTAAAAVTLAGTWAADRAERGFGRKDDGRIVIDEVAGQLVTLAPLVPLREALAAVPMPIFSLFFWLAVTGFVAFRVLDVWKPGPVRWAQDHFSGGLGVMADDVLAGVLGAALMAVVAVGALGLLAPGAGG